MELKASWIGICEQFGFPWNRRIKEFQILSDYPQIFLDKSLVFAKPGDGEGYANSVRFQPVRWTISYGNKGVLIDIDVRKLKPAPIVRFNDRSSASIQTLLMTVIAHFVVFLCCLAIYVFLAFPEPAPFWDWMANYIRCGVAVVLPLTCFVGGVRLAQRYHGSYFIVIMILVVTFLFAGYIMMFWLAFVPMRKPSESYITYLNNLRVSGAVTGFVSLAPWLALIMKPMGFDPFASLTTVTADQLKSTKEAG